MKHLIVLITFATALLFTSTGYSQTQTEGPLSYKSDIRLLHFGNETHNPGLRGPNSFRVRFQTTYTINSRNLLNARVAGSLSENGEAIRFSILSDGKKLDFGGLSFDTFNYQYSGKGTVVRVGRFQHNVDILSVSGRSNFRLQSILSSISWTDGVYLKQDLVQGWYTEAVAEYQHRDYLTYAYKDGLNFGNNTHNVAGFFNLENRQRDRFNFIQKGFSIFYAPNAFNFAGGYRDYVAVMSRIAYDLPRPGLLKGGSFRLTAEAGQNVNVGFNEGSNATISMGINNFAGKHRFLTELARSDAQWLTPSVYAPSSDEIEFRYAYDVSRNLNLCMRYRIRDFRASGVPNAYSTFFNATINF